MSVHSGRSSHGRQDVASFAGDSDTAQPVREDKPAKGVANEDPNIVFWEGDQDPANPMNWPTWKKVANVGIVSILTLLTSLGSVIFAPGVPRLMEEFGSDNELLAGFVVSIFVLGFAFGPLFLAPLSELYGRVWVYQVCNIGFVVFTVACAVSTNIGMLIAFRLLQGISGAAPIANGGGTIGDVVPQKHRGVALSIYSLAPLLGPVIGPVAGGFLAEAKGWRWDFWALAIAAGFLTVISFFIVQETYPVIILEKKAARLRKQTGNHALRSKLAPSGDRSTAQHFLHSILRPTKMLMKSPIVLFLALYAGLAYGYQYLMLSTFTYVFESRYNFSTSVSGLSFLGLGVGSVFGLLIGPLSDRFIMPNVKSANKEPGGSPKPEARLIPLAYTALFIPVGLFLYGWTVEYRIHWIVPIIGTSFVGFGILSVFFCITIYSVDAFKLYAASALAANALVRSVVGALLPLAGQSLYGKLGYGWGNSLLGFLALALLPITLVLLRYGERLRLKFDVGNL
ncbi:putative cycloheximide resistance protein [Rosellinia necatrix]|uniref:Putative cycloheximide resistance protein n=1 Tax=Rosellinia necatrix TaxID=77044 RepID=A0A1W2TN15_ROSNE|nr:putative cycloheximide resistance protein [Rosellinia necatrix]